MIPAEMLQDRNGDGLVDYLNARIYVSDHAAPIEIAAAANVAARLAFESLSIDLPLGFKMSAYDNSETTVALVIGSAAVRFTHGSTDNIVVTSDKSRIVIAIPVPADADTLARTFESSRYTDLNSRSDADPVSKNKRASLATLFTAEGLLDDRDGIPERMDTTIVLGPDVHSVEVIDLAARLALESAGVRFPLVITDWKSPLPPNAIVIGPSSYSSGFALQQGQGRIAITDGDSKNGIIIAITGADPSGESEALKHASHRLPSVWNYGKPYLQLSHIENDLRLFLSRRSPAGQAAAALPAARKLVRNLALEDRESAQLEILVEGDCGSCLDYMASQFPDIKVAASNLNIPSGPLVFEDTYTFPWEVHEARNRILHGIIPGIQSGSEVFIELRLSESPQVRLSLAREIQDRVLDSGANPAKFTIRVLAAHKQAYCWIDEFLKPRLKDASRIQIHYREIVENERSFVESGQRWLHELYPIDEILSRDLGIGLDRITFHKSDSLPGAAYEVSAEDSAGKPILRESFEPRFVIRPMFDAFPDYAQVRVNTGWLHARVDGSVIVDERIETDAEKFWNCYQSQTLPKIRDYILDLYDGKPRNECAPHFGTLEVELWLSEPDYRIGIGEERISTLEALHEDIYFETLLFLELLGLTNSGRVIPRVHCARDGQDGFARIRFTGKAGPNPRVDLQWTLRDGTAMRRTENLLPIRAVTPRIQSLRVQSGHRAVLSLGIADTLDTLENLELFETIREFHDHGVGLSWLSYDGLDLLQVGSIEVPHTVLRYCKPQIEPLPRTDESPNTPIVQWDTPIGPVECEKIIRRLAGFPEVCAFHAGASFLGNAIWAIDVTAASTGKYVSKTRASVTKPVLFITGRQHANEVSSTSHILKLAELLVTDPEIHKLLDHVNFILHPMTNPDGAALVDDLHRDTPDFMLHAGYLGALGSDVTAQQWSEDPLYPEARVRPELWKMWLPDVILNPHGYPSHEWVQLFAGYTAWVKSRHMTARDWWIPRGWFIPGYAYMDCSSEAALDLRDQVTAAMRPKLGAWNEQMVRRYAKYGVLDPETFKPQYCNGLLVYSPNQGLKPNPDGFSFMQRYPKVTLLETVTEIPDEVAQGEWLKTLAQAGLDFSVICAQYLAKNHNAVERFLKQSADTTELRIFRKRP